MPQTRYGISCIVTLPVGKWNGLGCKRLRQRFPNLVVKIGEDGYLNPEKGQTGDYLAQICSEITGRYDIDGIHLDYIRYPETWKIKVSSDRHCYKDSRRCKRQKTLGKDELFANWKG